jgi:L-ascorbate metabolism protein UlaG (beta-lactamase superfamily)
MPVQNGGMPSAEIYLSRWKNMLARWQSPGQADRAWILYSANYLLVTAGVRWAIDPLTFSWRVPSMPQGDISPLAKMDAIILTHSHADHLDMSLLGRLRDLPIKWVIPEFMLASLQPFRLPPKNVTIAQPLKPIYIEGLSLTPFDGLHLVPDSTLPGGIRGVPSMGYMAEFNHKKWLFPCDTRVFDASKLPDFGPLDGLFMHVFLGKGLAFDPAPSLLDPFCRFCVDLHPRRILLTHMYEWGRPPEELWTETHAGMIEKWFAENAPGVSVSHALLGDEVDL